jgi:lysine-N-methylase
MSRTLKSLPMIQNWDCHACGNCCTDYVVPVSAADRKRIEAQGWRQRPEFKDVPLFVRSTPWWQFWKKRYRLNQGKGHACIFLDEKKLCRIHAEFGFETKPFACRLYPYILIPAGDQWRIGMRYACPSAAANKGRALTERTAELDAFAAEMEEWDTEDRNRATPGTHRPPPLGGGQRLGWKDLEAVVDAWIAFLRDRADPFPRRMLRCLAFLRLAQALRLDNLSGARLRETIGMLLAAAGAEVPRDLGTMPKPGWIGRVLFRTTAALYLRKDSGTRIGVARRGRLALMAAMARMVRGAGKLPRLQQGLPEATFAELESQPLGDLSPLLRSKTFVLSILRSNLL